MGNLTEDITALVTDRGPCTGLEIRKAIGGPGSLDIWKTCKTSPRLRILTLGRRYLRLDRHVEGLARLSPSILREFFTYSVVGLAEDPVSLATRGEKVMTRIREISRSKLELARDMVAGVAGELEDGQGPGRQDICFLIAGDIVYEMAHDVPRPERSTGRLVRGSDIDLVVVVEDDTPDDLVRRLDDLIYQRKYRMLINPTINEEVDYKIKRVNLVREQARFDTFSNMVACKILEEAMLLHGNPLLFAQVKAIIDRSPAAGKLEGFERVAASFREKAERSILFDGLDEARVEEMHLFYSAEEFEEFE